MELVFLGTAGMVPTKERNVQSIYLDYKGEGILLDCGEGTQRQIQLAKLNAQKIRTILISHWHGDHVSGLVGLLQTIGNFSGHDTKSLRLFGPKGTTKHLNHLMNSCIFETKVDLDVTEIDAQEVKTIFETDEYTISAINLEHSTPCLGYKFAIKPKRRMNQKKLVQLGITGPNVGKLQEGKTITHKKLEIKPDEVSTSIPGKSIAFIFDTLLTDACHELAANVDLVVSEAVYLHELEHKAEEYKHMTAQQAAQVASMAGAQELILTHFSQRYKETTQLEQEAKAVFPNTICAYDFFKKKF
ncbi:ribonuclease Z [Candidatus Woesearchaeota archaeon]|nr:ribonuclease Z [Candidatus Woesearchaeota archaeon]